MNRRTLLGGLAALIAIAAALVIWNLLRDPDQGGSSGGERSSAPAGVAAAGGASRAASQGREPPALAAGSAAAAGEREEPEEEEEEDPANPIRDHRGKRASGRAPGTYPIKPELIRSLRAAIREPLKDCQQQFESEITEGARLTGRLQLAVAGGVLKVSRIEDLGQDGLPGGSRLVDCARKVFQSARINAGGHRDVASHTLNFPFRLPLK
jgi:hypothetical protein